MTADGAAAVQTIPAKVSYNWAPEGLLEQRARKLGLYQMYYIN